MIMGPAHNRAKPSGRTMPIRREPGRSRKNGPGPRDLVYRSASGQQNGRSPFGVEMLEHTLSWRSCLITAVAILALPALAPAATEPRQILVLHSFDYGPFDEVARAFRSDLGALSKDPITFVEIALQPSRLSEIGEDAMLLQHLFAALGQRQFDVVVTIGGPAAAFVQRHRSRLFPKTALLIAAADRRFLTPDTRTANDAATPISYQPALVIDTILRLKPETKTVFIVIGHSEPEQFWRQELERAFSTFAPRVGLRWSDGLSYAEILRQSSTLPPGSAIYYALLSRDAEGALQRESHTLADLHARANAPVFGVQSTQLGKGIVGGQLMDLDEVGRAAANAAWRILRGERPDTVDTPAQVPGAPIFDWRELQRWGIDEARLPPGAMVRFKPPSIWEAYGWEVAAGATLVAAQAVLVFGLLVLQAKRRRAEHSLRESEGRFRLLADAAPVMVWMTDTSQGCTDFNRAWLEFTGRTPEQELGFGYAEGIHPLDKDRCFEIFLEAFGRREEFRLEFRLRRHDGEYRWVLDIGVPRFAADRTFLGYIGSAVDITELKLAQAARARLGRAVAEAHDEERRRIARDLHDDVGQRMVGLTMQLHALARSVPADGGETRERLGDLRQQFESLAHDIQEVSRRVHSASLDAFDLDSAVTAFCEDLAALHGVRIELRRVDVPDLIPGAVSECLYRVLQEALTNALKHSGVSDFVVLLRGHASELELEVVDHGIGFGPGAAGPPGLGLTSIRERLQLVGGECVVDSRPGAGTRILARVPLPDGAAVTLAAADGPDHDRAIGF
jgi:PAS domain S-box-containing protein